MQIINTIYPKRLNDQADQSYLHQQNWPNINLQVILLANVYSEKDYNQQIANYFVNGLKNCVNKLLNISQSVSKTQLADAICSNFNAKLIEINEFSNKTSQKVYVDISAIFVLEQKIFCIFNETPHIFDIQKKSAHLLFYSQQTDKNTGFKVSQSHILTPRTHIIIVDSRFLKSKLAKGLLSKYLLLNDRSNFVEFKNTIEKLNISNLSLVEIVAAQSTEIVDKNTSFFTTLVTKVTTNAKKIFLAIKKASKKWWNNFWSKYINPNPKVSLLVGLSVAVVLIVVVGFLILNNPQQKKIVNQYSDLSQKVMQAKVLTEQNNSTQALELIDQTKQSLEGLSNTNKKELNSYATKNQKPTTDELLSQLLLSYDSLLSINRINSTLVASVDKSESLNNLSGSNQNLFVINNATSELVSIDKQSQVTTISKPNNTLKGCQGLIFEATTQSNYCNLDQHFYKIDSTGATSELQNGSGSWPNSNIFDFFSQNLYFVSESDNQILKYTKTSSGFGTKTNYLKSNYPEDTFKNTVSMAINGNIFVAKKDSTILLFNQGIKKDFTLDSAPNNLGEIKQMYYTPNPDTIYLLNTVGNFFEFKLTDSGAKYSKQYVVNETTTIDRFIVDKNLNQIFFTTKNNVKKIALRNSN